MGSPKKEPRGSQGATKGSGRAIAPRLWLAGAVAVVVLMAVTYLGVSRVRQTRRIARLPAVPELSAQGGAVRSHLANADRAARTHPTSSEVGALGLAYH